MFNIFVSDELRRRNEMEEVICGFDKLDMDMDINYTTRGKAIILATTFTRLRWELQNYLLAGWVAWR